MISKKDKEKITARLEQIKNIKLDDKCNIIKKDDKVLVKK